ncbi:hypothetical protein QOT17_022184 [Balamuthia mandrillaris]
MPTTLLLMSKSWAKHQVIIPTPDDCPWNSPILAIPKKDASGQLTEVHGCINPWAIDSVLMDDIYPIPSILDIVKHVASFFVTSSLDLIWSFLIKSSLSLKTSPNLPSPGKASIGYFVVLLLASRQFPCVCSV